MLFRVKYYDYYKLHIYALLNGTAKREDERERPPGDFVERVRIVAEPTHCALLGFVLSLMMVPAPRFELGTY